MKCGSWPLGVCSWSLRMKLPELADTLAQLGVEHVHLAVGPALEDGGKEYLAQAANAPWKITSTMIGFPQEDYSTLETIRKTGGIMPDGCWAENRRRFERAAAASSELGAPAISMHAGFLDHAAPELARKFSERIRILADVAGGLGLQLLLETGQETAKDLALFLGELNHPQVGLNFDPANMILYGKGDPVASLRILAPWIHHVHIKDARHAQTPGTWGREMPWGDGEVGGAAFVRALREAGFSGALAVEREGGANCLHDVRLAIERLLQASSAR